MFILPSKSPIVEVSAKLHFRTTKFAWALLHYQTNTPV